MHLSSVTSFQRQVTSERRFGMSSPTSGTGSGVPVAAVAGVQASCSTATASGHAPGVTTSTDVQAQRALLEHLFDRKVSEGDFWYVVVAEWLEHLKKFIGISTTRKYYNQRASSPPGPIVTRRDYAHTVDVVHEDAWRMLVQWYGVAEGHKPMKLVVYKYARGPEIEHNINSFKVMLSSSPPEDFHIVRFSKMEKVGHVEWKSRTLYAIPQNKETRIWAKADADCEWRPLFFRDKAIGHALDMDSDFTRPVIALEVCGEDQVWNCSPEGHACPQEIASGHLYETSLFDDVTTFWEAEIHDQIEQVGKTLIEKLHGNFAVFVQRAKEYIAARECQLRERERQVCARESVTERLASKLELKEQRLREETVACEEKIKEYESRRLELEREFAERQEEAEARLLVKEVELQKQRDELQTDKDKFQEELRRMAELAVIQEGRIKLDIGGHQFTTSLLTLTKDSDSMLAAMFSGRHHLKTEQDGSYFIDRDGTHFRYVLNYLRDGFVKDGTLPQSETMWRELLTEAEFYQLEGLADFLRKLLAASSKNSSSSSSSSSGSNGVSNSTSSHRLSGEDSLLPPDTFA